MLVAVLRELHVRARRAHQLGDDDTLGAVDDEGALLGHHGEVAHEDLLLADLARLPVHEGHRDEERRGVGHVFVATLLQGQGRLAELVLSEFHRVFLGVVLDGVDVLDGLPQTIFDEPSEGLELDSDQLWDIEDGCEFGEGLTGG